MRIDVDVSGTRADLQLLGPLVSAAALASVRTVAPMLQTRVRVNASTAHQSARGYRGHLPGTGPGPNVVTGDYRRSIRVAGPRRLPGVGVRARVFTNAAQAWRLERGFVGVDTLGRRAAQPPYPHWGPAADWVEPVFVQDLSARVNAAIHGLGKGT